MKRIIKKMALAAGALFVVFGVVTMSVWYVQAASYNNNTATGFTDVRTGNLKVQGTGLYDSNGTVRLQLGSTTTVNGILSFAVLNSSAPRDTSSAVAVTPTFIGQIIYNATDKELCFSTAAAIRSWVRISTPSAACAH